MRPSIERILQALLVNSESSRVVTLDEMGEALGTEVASADEVDALIAQLEAKGRVVTSPPEGDVQERLRRVLQAARELRGVLARKPTPPEIADRTGLDESAVRAALMLGRVMGR